MLSFFHTIVALFLAVSLEALVVSAGIPQGNIYGVNLGSWLLLEPWMLPIEWKEMGGEDCGNCADCIATEFAFAKAYPNTVDATFNKHWDTWFSQQDVDLFVKAGLNTVRVPLGYWIVEPLVDRNTEFYARGGIKQLRRGLQQLKEAGIAVVLDHHALPGVQTPGQAFAGKCTDDVQFYTPYNYHRALVWTAVMTTISHLDPAFESVFAIEAMNEPIMDASKTPGYGDFQKNFVKTVRAVELSLGIPVSGLTLPNFARGSNVTDTVFQLSKADNLFNAEVRAALRDAVPALVYVGLQLALPALASGTAIGKLNRDSLYANFMDVNWQWGNPSNPADAAIGPQIYDNHLYYSFGGVADANEEAYLTSICNLNRVEADAAVGNSPLYFGEWALSTNFDASDDFRKKWADAQKMAYNKGKGWLFWNFKTEELGNTGWQMGPQWSYEEGLKRGYLTWDPSTYNDPHVCDAYIGKTYTSITPTATATSATSETTSVIASATTSNVSATTSDAVSASTSVVASATTSAVSSATTSDVASATTSDVASATTSDVASATTSDVASATTSDVASATTSDVAPATTSDVASATVPA